MAMKRDTVIGTAGRHPEDHDGTPNPPVHHASTILFPTIEALEDAVNNLFESVNYGRIGTPTSHAFEEAVTALHGGLKTVSLPSGLSAIVTALMAFLENGDHVLMCDTVYGPTRARGCEHLLARAGVETTYYDPLIGAGIAELIRPNTKVIYMESPGSLTFEVQDVPAIAAAARDKGVVTMIDNTWASPFLCRPLELGVDVVIEAATKYISGHSDAMLGAVTMATDEHFRKIKWTAISLGAAAGPDDLYFGLRGLRTLSVRLERHQKNAHQVAQWLDGRAEVERVLYPALPGDPGHEIWQRDFDGASGLFGVLLGPGVLKSALAAMIDGLELFGIGESWGGYESLVLPTRPGRMRTATEWTHEGQSFRLHVGLEDPDDLIADLEKGLERLVAP
jgi:cystathionine beta-lyase